MKANDKRLTDEINRLLQEIETFIVQMFSAALGIHSVKKALREGNVFWFSRNSTANNQINSILADFNKNVNAVFLTSIAKSQILGQEKHFFNMRSLLSKRPQQLRYFEEITKRTTEQTRNIGSLQSAQRFMNMKKAGRTLSDRVWNLSGNAKKEIEVIIQNGIIQGKSADELSKNLRKYLKEPDKLFRRVKNKETGELEWSKAAKQFNPGQGVYRSSYQNAMRLARTEITSAYRLAQWEAMQKDPQITGIRIQLSNNHTLNGKPFVDICDDLQGVYPKTFMWQGWHPQCRCVMTPVLVGGEDFRAMVDAEIIGEEYEPQQINEMPENFNEWLSENSERLQNAKQLPFWLEDNNIKMLFS